MLESWQAIWFLDRDLYVFCFNNSDGKIVTLGNPNAKQV